MKNAELIADLQSNIVGEPFPLMRKAADSIDALEAEVERLNMALHGYQVAIETAEESLKDRVALAMEVDRLSAAGASHCGHRPPCEECRLYPPTAQQAQPESAKFINCQYGESGYACCEGRPCQADIHNESIAQQASVPEGWELVPIEPTGKITMENTLENEMLDAAVSWCDSNGMNVLEPEQLASLVNSLHITVRDTAQPVQVNAMLVEALEAAEKLEHAALVALSEATYELKVGNTYTTATDTYKANNELIHRLDKILNLQYRDRKREARLAARQAQPERAPLSCTWTQEDDFDTPGVYHTSCGEMWSFTEGGIKENNTKFCPHCGGGIKQGGQHD